MDSVRSSVANGQSVDASYLLAFAFMQNNVTSERTVNLKPKLRLASKLLRSPDNLGAQLPDESKPPLLRYWSTASSLIFACSIIRPGRKDVKCASMYSSKLLR